MAQLTALTKEVLAAILKSIDEGIHVVDVDGITIFYNEVAAAHDGMEVCEVLGKPLLASFPSLTEESSTLLMVLKTKKPIYHQIQVYQNIHGRRIETVNTTLPIFLSGELVGAIEIAKDYSSIKRLSERLLDLQKSLYKKKANAVSEKAIYTMEDLKTVDPGFIHLKQEAKKLAKSDAPMLVYGESGTGKELFVHGIHHESNRANGPFIAQNCAAIPETLLEGILFGTAKGSYTGAVDRKGLFELADGGTLFLDELHAMPKELQAKMLRVLEDGLIRRVGGSANIRVNVRIIAAMNEHPQEALKHGRLRPDLFYRLNVFTFFLPPLRERRADIHFLTEYFLDFFSKKTAQYVKEVSQELKEFFGEYNWPGNVRELKHTLEYMVNVSENSILTLADLPILLKQSVPALMEDTTGNSPLSLRKNLMELEDRLIAKALERTKGNIYQAARLLEIPRQTLQYKLKKFQQ